MMNPTELAADKEAFSLLRGECEKIIDTQKRLPEFVFQRPFAKYFAIEYGHIYSREFGAFLSRMSGIFEDESVNYMTLDPRADEDCYLRSSYFGLASFEPSSLVERYVPALSRDTNGPRLLVGSNVGAFWGSSLKWGISCDRISWEMAVVAVPEDVDVPIISGFRCMDAAWLSGYMKSQYHWRLSTALDFNQRFLANYAI